MLSTIQSWVSLTAVYFMQFRFSRADIVSLLILIMKINIMDSNAIWFQVQLQCDWKQLEIRQNNGILNLKISLWQIPRRNFK